ncbi:MAG: hypothetical protein Mars2KO_31440 [Maribacter sp.]
MSDWSESSRTYNNFINFEFQELETLLENAKIPVRIPWYFVGELWCGQKKDHL